MANTVFSNVDFEFRRGSQKALENTSISNGSFNVVLDTDELYIDIDNRRIPMTSIIIKPTENEIFAIPNPEPKVYFSLDTKNLLFYDTKTLTWLYVGCEHVKYSEKAGADEKGRNIVKTYETKVEAAASFDDVEDSLKEIRETISKINSFDVVVLSSGDELPTEGLEHTIYFKPVEDSLAEGEEYYDEYIWIKSKGYFESIGTSTIKLANYYTKDEIDGKMSTLQKTVTEHIDSSDKTIDELKTKVSANEQNVAALKSSVENNYAVLNSKNTTLTADYNNLSSEVANNKSSIEDINTSFDARMSKMENTQAEDEKNIKSNADDIKNLQGTDDIIKKQLETDEQNISTLDSNVKKAITAVNANSKSVESLQKTSDNHESRISVLEAGGGSSSSGGSGGGGSASQYVGCTDTEDGQGGSLLPAKAGQGDYYFKGAGLWAPLPSPDLYRGPYEETTITTSSTGTDSAETVVVPGSAGIVPGAEPGQEDYVFVGKGDWKDLKLKELGYFKSVTANGKVISFVYGDGRVIDIITQDTNTTYNVGNSSEAGITKIYNSTGSNIDGSMTQDAITKNMDTLKKNLEYKISNLVGFEVNILNSKNELPITGNSNVMYLVPGDTEATFYDEYVWILDDGTSGHYVHIGVTSVTFNNYYTKEEVDNLLLAVKRELGYDSDLYTISDNGKNVTIDYGDEG